MARQPISEISCGLAAEARKGAGGEKYYAGIENWLKSPFR